MIGFNWPLQHQPEHDEGRGQSASTRVLFQQSEGRLHADHLEFAISSKTALMRLPFWWSDSAGEQSKHTVDGKGNLGPRKGMIPTRQKSWLIFLLEPMPREYVLLADNARSGTHAHSSTSVYSVTTI